jgi:hypothetical protein
MQIPRYRAATSRELKRKPRLAASPWSHEGDKARASESCFQLPELA